MPFKSKAQRRYMWAKHPGIARRWTDTYGSGGKRLPERKRKRKTSRRRQRRRANGRFA